MKIKKVKILIVAVSVIFIMVCIVVMMAKFMHYDVAVYPNEKTSVFVKKVDNGNNFFGFLNRTPQKELKRGDIIVYYNPLEFDTKITSRKIFCSRLIALPGDIVYIDDAKLYVNNEEVDENYETYNIYRVSADSITDFKSVLGKYNVDIKDVINGSKACNFFCSKSEFANISEKEKSFVDFRQLIDRDDWKDMDIFPSSSFFAWNKDNFGPLYLPKENDVVKFTSKTVPMYKNIIDGFEDNDLVFNTYKVYINNTEIYQYQVKKNYFFLMNDDRTNKRDSRGFGAIPEELIIGKVYSHE